MDMQSEPDETIAMKINEVGYERGALGGGGRGIGPFRKADICREAQIGEERGFSRIAVTTWQNQNRNSGDAQELGLWGS